MFEVSIINAVLYTIFLVSTFYLFFCVYAQKFLRPNFRVLIYYISVFSLFGMFGEHFTNTLYELLFGSPLWEYRVYPAHNGNITYFFISAWGTLGLYTYFRNQVFRKNSNVRSLYSGLILGAEAILIELFVNIPFYLLFNEYIFYYFPANLGPVSHFSCLQVIPFYFIVGYVTGKLIEQQEKINYRGMKATLALYWMLIITFVFLP